jgi:two-component system response regulator HydG
MPRNVVVLLRLSDASLAERARLLCLGLGLSVCREDDGPRGGGPDLVVVEETGDLARLRQLRASLPDALVIVLPATSPHRALEMLEMALPEKGSRGRWRPGGTMALHGESPAMQQLRRDIDDLARSSCNVIVTGETGSGKELVARSIHDASTRSGGPFVSINCAALPDSLVESELFGYEKGAFTGAIGAYPGKFTLADRGTVFLDEVGDMSLFAQAKLLRAIDERSVFRLGAVRSVPVDFRLISATNRDLFTDSRRGLFRLDLYYRLRVAHIHVPPLRARRDDIPLLAAQFARNLAEAAGDTPPEFSAEAMEAIYLHEWPGNVRELRNTVEAALVRARGARRIEVRDLPFDGPANGSAPVPLVLEPTSPATMPAVERERIKRALEEAGGNKSVAAARLQWSRMTLYRKLAKYHIA